MSDLLDLADRMCSGMAIHYDRHGAGEYDVLRALPRRTRNRLRGAGYLSSRGEYPDVFAMALRQETPGGEGMSDADLILRWCRLIMAGLAERRSERKRARRRRLHLAAGHPTEYAYRTAQAVAAGFRSLWAMRRARGWA